MKKTVMPAMAGVFALVAGLVPASAQQLDPNLQLPNTQGTNPPPGQGLSPELQLNPPQIQQPFPAQNALPPQADPTRRVRPPQQLQPGQTVIERPRPELQPLGVRAGGFTLLPTIETDFTYNDNIFGTQNKTSDDFILDIKPGFVAQSNWSRHSLRFEGSADVGRFKTFSRENYVDFLSGLSGRYDIGPRTQATAALRVQQFHEGGTSITAPTDRIEASVYQAYVGSLGLTQKFNRVNLGVSVDANYFNYDPVKIASGAKQNQNYRDYWQYDYSTRVGYEFIRGLEAFVRGTYTVVDYTSNAANVGSNSTGYEIVAGSAVELTQLLTGEIFGGYLTRDFSRQGTKDFTGPTFGGQLNWSVTPLTTIRSQVTRQILAGAATDSNGIEETVYAVGVDHELLRNLIVNGRFQVRTDNFQGGGTTTGGTTTGGTTGGGNESDTYYTASTGATYNLTRNFFVGGTYTFEHRDSNVANNSYNNNIVVLRVGAQL